MLELCENSQIIVYPGHGIHYAPLKFMNTEDISDQEKTLTMKKTRWTAKEPLYIQNNVLVHENTLRCIVSPDYYL